MQTIDFKTRTIMNATPFPGRDDKWLVALDIGYSAVKGISQNALWCFPSYAKKIPNDRESMAASSSTDIRYKDETGTWVVGNLAFDEATVDAVVESEAEQYGRHRYFSEMFRVITSVGIAMGLQVNSFGNPEGKEIVVQTGLPPKYVDGEDNNDLTEAIEGHYSFDLAIGGKEFKHYEFDILRNNIYIIAQPMGAMVSASVDKKGKNLPQARDYFKSTVLVFDPGFGTVDTYFVHKGNIMKERGETFDNYGMHEILQRTCNDINKEYRTSFTVIDLLANMEKGTVKITNKKAMTSFRFDFSALLEKNCKEVCSETIEKLKSVYNYFQNIDYIIAAGGTYDAWSNIFNQAFAGLDGLELISSNCNDVSISNIFSNVRGYYFFRHNAKM